MITKKVNDFDTEAYCNQADKSLDNKRKLMSFDITCKCCGVEYTEHLTDYDDVFRKQGFHLCEEGSYTPWAVYSDGTVDIMELKKQR